MRPLDQVLERLSGSPFRRRFRLGSRERGYLEAKGVETMLAHARDFVDQRLAPAEPLNDGKQTPMRGHPVFIAQHATATCCRSCLAKWHGVPAGRALSGPEKAQVIAAIEHWILTTGQG